MPTPAELVTLERRLSVERLAPYRAAVSGDLRQAVRLYEWNRDLTTAFSGSIGDLEILLRNSMHEQLTVWSTRRFGEARWYVDPGRLLTPEARLDIEAARRRATRGGSAETPGRIVAELSFGFWSFLLSGRYDRTLWRMCLRRAFPGQGGARRPVNDAVRDLHLLRNRMAHLEPIHNRPLDALHSTTLTVAGWICPVSRAWIEQRCQVQDVLAERP